MRNRIGRNYLIFTPLMMSAELHAGLLRRSRRLFPCQFSRRLDRLILPAVSPSDAPYQEMSDDDNIYTVAEIPQYRCTAVFSDGLISCRELPKNTGIVKSTKTLTRCGIDESYIFKQGPPSQHSMLCYTFYRKLIAKQPYEAK